MDLPKISIQVDPNNPRDKEIIKMLSVIQEMTYELSAAKAELTKLRAVAEAAREVCQECIDEAHSEGWECACEVCTSKAVKQALAELDKEGNV